MYALGSIGQLDHRSRDKRLAHASLRESSWIAQMRRKGLTGY